MKFEKTLKSKQVHGIFGGTFILALLSSAVFRLQILVSDFFQIVFLGRWKAFIRVPFGNEVDFRDIRNVSLHMYWLKIKISENWDFCRWRSNDDSDINVFMSLENPCTFLLAKEKTWKRTFNINSVLSQNRAEKQIMPFKTTVNWLFNDMWYYLVSAFLSEK